MYIIIKLHINLLNYKQQKLNKTRITYMIDKVTRK